MDVGEATKWAAIVGSITMGGGTFLQQFFARRKDRETADNESEQIQAEREKTREESRQSDLDRLYKGLWDQVAALRTTVDEQGRSMVALRDDNDALRREMSALRGENDRLSTEVRHLSTENTNLRIYEARNAALQTQVQALQTRIQELQSDKPPPAQREGSPE